MRTGTNHFQSLEKAGLYYLNYNPFENSRFISEIVQEKIDNSEIVIGPPTLKPGETMYVNDEGRYVIETEER